MGTSLSLRSDDRRRMPPMPVQSGILRTTGIGAAVLVAAALVTPGSNGARAAQPATPQDLLRLFDDFVAFERPALKDGAPDYTAAMLQRKRQELKSYQSR